MKILLTGVTGYIGKRLLPVLLNEGHEVFCCVRDPERFNSEYYESTKLHVIKADFLDYDSLRDIPQKIDVAYYLIHSMSASIHDFDSMEKNCAENFKNRISDTEAHQVIYLSGIVNANELSNHLKSRKTVEAILSKGTYHLTTLRAGIIIGSGSASFEIMRDLVEKLPVMVAPRWVETKSQPIAIRNVLQFLKGVLLFEKCYDQSFDIGGPQVLTYKEMLLKFAKVRELKRHIFTVPVMTPKLSSYWLYFVTSTSYKLAINLVDSMKIEVIAEKNPLQEWLGIDLLTYEEAIQQAFGKIEQQNVLSSWTDALSSRTIEEGIEKHLNVPEFGCLKDERVLDISDEQATLKNIWSLGGDNGWPYANWLWQFRGFLDKIVGGVGLRRGRKNPIEINAGESLDFWRVLVASPTQKRLLLYAEMKLPGEAWLEFKIEDKKLIQTATFRPKGVWGRLYWYSVWPFHHLIFEGMARRVGR
ncbi:SDR family oxidoreductase [Marinilabilia rubra]|uniref:DUF2867 domain-containing protein n=1 Tax=Marinilabilia rubra TaxID=2162893 RepID=A0A2U2BC93_9BACT|nr:SDR family oxidoreductase [Marinilabilia rubra]PWE00688.1 DUF2867 domain-containing protein [Marinilabilia rubra]